MRKKNRKLVVALFFMILLLSGTYTDVPRVNAGSYPAIMLEGIPYFPQKISSDCGISSISMIEAYSLGYDSSFYDAIYEGVYAANGFSLSIGKAVNNGKYTDISKNLESVYKQLKDGKPVLVYRGDSSYHWSVIVGYNGSTTSLQKSGFVVYNTARGTEVGKPYTSNFSDWLSGNSWKHAKVRNTGAIAGVTKEVSTLTLENACYPINVKKGSGMGAGGLVISNSNITSVTTGVKTTNGTVKFSANATPNRKYYALLSLDGSMKFGSLSSGTYIYYVNATDSTGATINWEKQFTVSSSSASKGQETVTSDGSHSEEKTIFAKAYSENVSETNAVIKATLNDTYYLSTAGVYFGTDVSNLQKITETANCNAKWLTYDANKWIGTLHPGTNYYYQVYVVIDGVEHRADLQQFTTLDQSKPNIDLVEIVEVTATGYTVRCKVSDNGYVEKVCFPTWTDANGQDDICGTWDVDTAIYAPDANGYYSFRVETSAHNNESGRYITHIYAYDTAGNVAEVALTGCEIYQLQSISLSSSSYVAKVGEEFSLTVNYNPDNTTENKAVMWSTSNSAVAVVDDGKVTAKAVGTATITANVGGKIATCDITVESAEVTLQSISLSKTSNSVKVGEAFTLSVSYNPSETTTDKTVSWKSSDTNVATVDSNGKVTAKAVGTATITANVGGKIATCDITVESAEVTLQSISLSETSNSVKVGETFTLSVSYNPSETTTDKTVSWKSSDTNVATVDSNGKVTAKTVGNTTITAQVADKTATCNVIVQSDNTISSSGIYLFSVDRNIIRAGMTTSLKESTDIEYRWTAYSAENPTKVVVQDWTTNDEWLNWEPEEFGEYRLICEARIKNEPSKVATAETEAIRFTPYIKGKCQMPYTGEGGGYLIGIETYENPNQSYQYEMLILDCTLLAQGKDAWVWSTGRYTVPEGNAGWCVWQPQYGYYWTLFRVYDADGNMIDQDCYGFVNAY